MDRKLLSVDGHAVDAYAGTFTGTFEVTGPNALHMAYDEEVLLVVRAHVKVPRLKETAKGDIVRVNVLGVQEVGVVRSDSLKKHLCESLGLQQLETPVEPENRGKGQSTIPPDLAEEETAGQEPDPEPEELHLVETEEVFSPTEVERVPMRPTPAGPEKSGPKTVAARKDKRLAAFLDVS